MLLLVKQLLAVVLAVDIEQCAADPPQLGHGDRLAADAAGVLAVGVDLPLEQQLPLLGGQAALRERRQRRYAGKHRADESLCRARADQIPAGALAQHGPHGVDHNTFPRAGLAGEGIEPTVKGDVRLLNHSDVFNMEQL